MFRGVPSFPAWSTGFSARILARVRGRSGKDRELALCSNTAHNAGCRLNSMQRLHRSWEGLYWWRKNTRIGRLKLAGKGPRGPKH